MVNVVPREFQGQKPLVVQALRVFGLGTSQETTFTMLPPMLFQRIPLFCNPALVKWDSLQPILPLRVLW